MPVTVINKPQTLPVTLDEAKTHCRMDLNDTSEDAWLTRVIRALAESYQRICNRQLVHATLRVSLSEWKQRMRLHRSPVVDDDQVTEVEYRDSNGTWQTVTTSNYELNVDASPGYIRFINDYDVPDVYDDEDYPWRVTYKAGYSADETNVPEDAQLWILEKVGSYYLQREDLAIGTIVRQIRELTDPLLDRSIRFS